MLQKFIIPVVSIFYIHNPQCNVIQSFVFLFCQAIWWNYLSEITSGVIWSLEWLFLPHIMHLTYIHMGVSISVTYFMYCCIRHVFLFLGGSIWQRSCILVFNSYWYSIHTGIQFILVFNSSLLNWLLVVVLGVHIPQYAHLTSFSSGMQFISTKLILGGPSAIIIPDFFYIYNLFYVPV